MGLVSILVFLSVFAVVALVLSALGRNVSSPEEAGNTLATVIARSETPEAEREDTDVQRTYVLSSIDWVNRLLLKSRLADKLHRILEQAELNWTPGRLLLMSLAAWTAAAALVNLRMNDGFSSALLGLPAGALPFYWAFRKRTARFNAFGKALPQAIDLITNALRAGHSLNGAFNIVATDSEDPVRREFAMFVDAQNFGVDIWTAMDTMLERIPLPDLRIVATTILVTKESGGNLAEAMDNCSYLIRERFRLMDQVRVHTAQSRTSGNLLMCAPLAVGVVLAIVSPSYLTPLFNTDLGHKLLGIGATLNIVGLLLIRKIVNIRL